MSNDLQVPDYLKELMESSSAAKTEDMVSAGSSVPRISLKGMRFRFKEDGEEVEVVKDDLDCVIVGMLPEHGTAKTFYEGAYNPDSSEPPDCSSSNGVTPDSWVTNPVHNNCATCPNNKFGSAISKQTGKKAKACRDSKRLYIVKAQDMKDEKPQHWLLNVTVSSLKPLTEYSKSLSKDGITTPAVVITRLSFDEDSEFPKLNFKAMGVLKKEMAQASLAIAEEKEWEFGLTSNAPQLENNKQAMPAIESKPETDAPAEPTKRESSEAVDDILEQW